MTRVQFNRHLINALRLTESFCVKCPHLGSNWKLSKVTWLTRVYRCKIPALKFVQIQYRFMKRYIFLSRINRGILTEIFAYSLQGINVDHVVLVMTLCSPIGRSITRICSLDLLRMSRSWNAVADAAEVLPNYDFRLGNTSINDVVSRSGFLYN